MELNVRDRLSIIQMLPQNGSLVEMVDILEIVKKVRIEKEESDRINFKETEGRVTWNLLADNPVSIEFTFEQIKILKDCVTKLDSDKKINASNLDVCLKINKL